MQKNLNTIKQTLKDKYLIKPIDFKFFKIENLIKIA